MFKLQPHGFRNRDLRQFTADLRGVDPDSVTVGQMTYDWTVSSLVDRQLILPGSADRRNGYGIDTTSVHR